MASSNPQSQAPRRSRESDKVGSSFKKQEEIGRGSFATVYKALHTDSRGTETIVAIKSVNVGKLNKKLKDNLTSEISILKSLHHPHIAALIDCKETTQHIHLIMEYVALGDLSQFIKKRDHLKDSPYVGNMMTKYPNPKAGGLHEVVVRHFLQQLSSALQFLRVRDLIHRDVKPQNLLLNPSPEYFSRTKPIPMPYQADKDALEPICGIRSLPMLKIADFGFARSLPSTSLAETLCGSPLYMAPEILRYEKYDAKADLWSVGTVLYEMVTAKPPFRAANHVELLRRIEKTNDVIKFPEEILISDPLKKLIRALLKRVPQERISFPDFFDNEIITQSIPGLVDEDLPSQSPTSAAAASMLNAPGTPVSATSRRGSSRTDPTDTTKPGRIQPLESPYPTPRTTPVETPRARGSSMSHRRPSSIDNATLAPASPAQRIDRVSQPPALATRPALAHTATAPARAQLVQTGTVPSSAAMVRQASADLPQRGSLRKQMEPLLDDSSEAERMAQDIAFEREYVVVEKKAVEVNALADEMSAQGTMARAIAGSAPAQSTAMVRRATTHGTPTSPGSVQTAASRAVQIAQGKRPDIGHQRQASYERRYGPSPQSASSAISRALSLASGRLFGPAGFSAPINFSRAGRSPPAMHSPFPTYPGTQANSLVLVGDNKSSPADEDARCLQLVEDLAHRSDVVFGFAEVKYKQLTPATPGPEQPALDREQASSDGANEEDTADDLTIDAVITVSEEALVLYVKTLVLLQKAMDRAGKWWNRKKRDGDPLRGTASSVSVGQRMNNVVQWTRERFNRVLEKTDLVRLKLIASQKRLPEDHPSHPSNVQTTLSTVGVSSSSDQVVVTSGITAEKLMYDRALEMSRSAAISELTGEDLPGCEISYVTAIRMLEAVLESDEDTSRSTGDKADAPAVDAPIVGLEKEDRETILQMVKNIRGRLDSLRKKLHVLQKRASAPSISTPRQESPPIHHRTSNPALQR